MGDKEFRGYSMLANAPKSGEEIGVLERRLVIGWRLVLSSVGKKGRRFYGVAAIGRGFCVCFRSVFPGLLCFWEREWRRRRGNEGDARLFCSSFVSLVLLTLTFFSVL